MTGDPHPPNAMLKVVACTPAFNEDRCLGIGSVVGAGGQGDRVRRRVGGSDGGHER